MISSNPTAAATTVAKPIPKKWKTIAAIRETGLKYIEDRRSGIIRSFRTPWKALNFLLLEGLDWGTCLTIVGRPGTGKTAVLDQILNNAQDNNLDIDFAVLKFQFELPDHISAAREFTQVTNLEMRELYSVDAGCKLAESHLNAIRKYNIAKKEDKIFQISETMTVKAMKVAILEFYKSMGNIPIVVGIDHTLLTKKDLTESGQLETLYALGNMIIELKKSIPVIFILLSQMNRAIEDATRRNPDSIGNHPTSGDIFGSDALMHCSDVVMIMTRPSNLNISSYGPYKILVTPDLIPTHLIKNRNGGEALFFLRSNLQRFQLVEGPNPAQKAGAPQIFSNTSTNP